MQVNIGRTFITFFDHDTGEPQFAGSYTQIEAMQFGPQAVAFEVADLTELSIKSEWNELYTPAVLAYLNGTRPGSPSMDAAVAYFTSLKSVWTNPIYSGTTYGIGEDNPLDSYYLTNQQAARAVMVMLEDVSSFQTRYAITACCTTGRNFLFAGYSKIVRPVCPGPPPAQPSPSPPPPSKPPPSPPPPSPPPPVPPHDCSNLEARSDLASVASSLIQPYTTPKPTCGCARDGETFCLDDDDLTLAPPPSPPGTDYVVPDSELYTAQISDARLSSVYTADCEANRALERSASAWHNPHRSLSAACSLLSACHCLHLPWSRCSPLAARCSLLAARQPLSPLG